MLFEDLEFVPAQDNCETLLPQHISSPTCSQSCHEVRGGGQRTAGEDYVEPS